MRKLFLLGTLIVLLNGCKDRDREIEVEVKFKGTGNGEFEICFSEEDHFKPEDLGYRVYVTTNNGLTMDVERDVIIEQCVQDDMCQYKKMGAYSDKDYENMKTHFVPGNIKKIKVEIFYRGEYNKPFITKELNDL